MRDDSAPDPVRDYAAQAVAYVRSALSLELACDSDTLPIADHYLRSVPLDQAQAVALVTATMGAYFGEVVRQSLGGHWDARADEPMTWRLVLPSGLSFVPAGIVASVMARSDDLGELDTGLDAPPTVQPHLEAALSRMGDVTEEEYYSLCGRFDTLAHLQEVLAAMALVERHQN